MPVSSAARDEPAEIRCDKCGRRVAQRNNADGGGYVLRTSIVTVSPDFRTVQIMCRHCKQRTQVPLMAKPARQIVVRRKRLTSTVALDRLEATSQEPAV